MSTLTIRLPEDLASRLKNTAASAEKMARPQTDAKRVVQLTLAGMIATLSTKIRPDFLIVNWPIAVSFIAPSQL